MAEEEQTEEPLEDAQDAEAREKDEKTMEAIRENPLEKAEELLKTIKGENDRKEELLLREEKLRASQLLGGKASAGKVPPDKKEDTPEEYAQKALRGEL